jgi:hypothetical protein
MVLVVGYIAWPDRQIRSGDRNLSGPSVTYT